MRYASKALIKTLVDHGASTYILDSRGHTPYDYLTRYGGMAGNGRPTKETYGDTNQYLTAGDREELRVSLLPPSPENKKLLSQQETLKAENLYRQGKLQQSYLSLRKALSLDEASERAQSTKS